MATNYPITEAEIKEGFTTTASTADIEGFISFSNKADLCLRTNNVEQSLGQTLKRLFVRHMLTQSRDGGSVTHERAVSGASRSYESFEAGNTGYLDTLKRLDSAGCVYVLASSNAPIQLRAAGRNPNRRSSWNTI